MRFRLGPIIFCSFCTSLGVSSGFCTFNELFRVFSWSMEALKIGVVTGRRHDGSEWTASDKSTRVLGALPHKAALVQVRGDWEWLSQCFRFRHVGNENFCWMCEATHTGPFSFHNMADGAAYCPTTVTHEG